MTDRIPEGLIADLNVALLPQLADEFEALRRRLARRGIDIEPLTDAAGRLSVTVPAGATADPAIPGTPLGLLDSLEDCAVIHDLTRSTPGLWLQIPAEGLADPAGLRQAAAGFGLHVAAVSPEGPADRGGEPGRSGFGALADARAAVRAAAVARTVAAITLGESLGAGVLGIGLVGSPGFAGQTHLGQAFDRARDSLREIALALPPGWRLHLSNESGERPDRLGGSGGPGTALLLLAEAAGPQALCLIDPSSPASPGRAAPDIALLARAGRLAGLRLDGAGPLSGPPDPFGLFLAFNELIEAGDGITPAYVIGPGIAGADPVESLIAAANETSRACLQALMVDRHLLHEAQVRGDPVMAHQALRDAFHTDVTPILAEARHRSGGAIDPVAAFRASGYRLAKTRERAAGPPPGRR